MSERQPRLFALAIEARSVDLGLPDSDIVYRRDLIDPEDGDRLLDELITTSSWRQDTIRMYGREVPVPRLNAWHGDPGRTYAYSGITLDPEPWTPPLLEIKALVEAEAGAAFNSVLVNLYRDGSDGVAWHSDDEPELGPAPTIASVSLGATRRFQLRHREDHSRREAIDLEHGSVLVMGGPTQRCWHHQVPKTTRPVGPRVNLTFRRIL